MAEDASRQFTAARPEQALMAATFCSADDPLGVGPDKARTRPTP
jgi:hypothetical protein